VEGGGGRRGVVFPIVQRVSVTNRQLLSFPSFTTQFKAVMLGVHSMSPCHLSRHLLPHPPHFRPSWIHPIEDYNQLLLERVRILATDLSRKIVIVPI
jgi:hypothetical protein